MTVTANSIITPQTPKSYLAALTTANTTFTSSPTNAVLLATAGPAGGRLTRLWAIPCETVSANHIQLYRSLDGGTTKRLAGAILMPATTVDATHAATPADFGFSDDNPLVLSAGEQIYMAEGLTKSVTVLAEGADY
jgi:hypothetical protein